MENPLDHLARRGLRIAHDLLDRIHRRRWHPTLLEELQQRLAIVRADRVGDRRLQLVAMPHASEVRGELVVSQRGDVERGDQPLPEPVVGPGDEHPLAVAAAEVAIGRERGMG